MTSQTMPKQTNRQTEIASVSGTPSAPEDGRVSGYRALVGGLILAFAVVAALAAGGWGLISSVAQGASPALVGEDVEVSGGLLRVDAVTPEHMVPMQSDKFSQNGMGGMSSMGMDMAPEGQERFTVGFTLTAQDGDLAYAAEDFRVGGEKFEGAKPIRSQLGDGIVPEGSAVAGNLVFQVPEGAKGLELSFDGGRPVALDLPANGDSHGESHANQQDDSHDH